MKLTAVEWYAKQMQLKEQFTQEEFNDITNQAIEMKGKKLELDIIVDVLSKIRQDDFYFKSYSKDIIKSYINQEIEQMYSEENMKEAFIEGYKQRAEKSDLIFDNASRMYAIALFKQFKNK